MSWAGDGEVEVYGCLWVKLGEKVVIIRLFLGIKHLSFGVASLWLYPSKNLIGWCLCGFQLSEPTSFVDWWYTQLNGSRRKSWCVTDEACHPSRLCLKIGDVYGQIIFPLGESTILGVCTISDRPMWWCFFLSVACHTIGILKDPGSWRSMNDISSLFSEDVLNEGFQKYGYLNGWMVYFMEIPIIMDDDWGYPYFRKAPNEVWQMGTVPGNTDQLWPKLIIFPYTFLIWHTSLLAALRRSSRLRGVGLQRTTLVARVAAAGGDHPIRGDREDLFWGVSLNGDSPIFFWVLLENAIKVDDIGVHLF